jgi:hypothetical protein
MQQHFIRGLTVTGHKFERKDDTECLKSCATFSKFSPQCKSGGLYKRGLSVFLSMTIK